MTPATGQPVSGNRGSAGNFGFDVNSVRRSVTGQQGRPAPGRPPDPGQAGHQGLSHTVTAAGQQASRGQEGGSRPAARRKQCSETARTLMLTGAPPGLPSAPCTEGQGAGVLWQTRGGKLTNSILVSQGPGEGDPLVACGRLAAPQMSTMDMTARAGWREGTVLVRVACGRHSHLELDSGHSGLGLP